MIQNKKLYQPSKDAYHSNVCFYYLNSAYGQTIPSLIVLFWHNCWRQVGIPARNYFIQNFCCNEELLVLYKIKHPLATEMQ